MTPAEVCVGHGLRSALQVIQIPGNKSGQTIVYAILHAVTEVQGKGIALRL
jgi:hypothetical protein